MKSILTTVLVLTAAATAQAAGIQITEWMYSGANGEFIEFTNTSNVPIDMTNWSYSDSDRQPGDVSFGSVFGVLQPGESVIFTEANPAAFRLAWGLPSWIKVFGPNTNSNLGRNDEINLYDQDNVLVDTLAYGDQTYPGSIRTQNVSCNIPAADYGYTTVRTIAQGWVAATVGDAYGSWSSTGGDIGSPGRVPEPITVALMTLGGAVLLGRRRSAGI